VIPPSLPPRIPSGFVVDGTSLISVSNARSRSARGIARRLTAGESWIQTFSSYPRLPPSSAFQSRCLGADRVIGVRSILCWSKPDSNPRSHCDRSPPRHPAKISGPMMVAPTGWDAGSVTHPACPQGESEFQGSRALLFLQLATASAEFPEISPQRLAELSEGR
jgi:hypothetical protein